MDISFIGTVKSINNWSNSTKKKDIILREKMTGEDIIILCLEDKFSMLKKCKKGKEMKVYAKIKIEEFATFKRNYIYLEHIAVVTK